MNNRLVATLILLALIVLALLMCGRLYGLPVGQPPAAFPTFSASPLPGDNPAEVYTAAQSTLAASQSEMTELSRQATAVSLNIDQITNVAAQTTLEYHQQQLMELSIQSTEVSLNMARAAATQQSIVQQTQIVWDATASAQSQATTATYSPAHRGWGDGLSAADAIGGVAHKYYLAR